MEKVTSNKYFPTVQSVAIALLVTLVLILLENYIPFLFSWLGPIAFPSLFALCFQLNRNTVYLPVFMVCCVALVPYYYLITADMSVTDTLGQEIHKVLMYLCLITTALTLALMAYIRYKAVRQ